MKFEIRNANTQELVICVRNDDYPASLEVRKVYEALPDEMASRHGLIRVIDESGEDYLYPADYFVKVELPQSVSNCLKTRPATEVAG